MKIEEIERVLSLDEIEVDNDLYSRLPGWQEYYDGYDDEVWCFYIDYLNYQKEILKRQIRATKIVDIGCNIGIQSVVFDVPYVGIDLCDNGKYFWNKAGNEYFVGRFPNNDYSELIEGSVVISNMSLCYHQPEVDPKEAGMKLASAEAVFISAPYGFVIDLALAGGFEVDILREERKSFWSEIAGNYLLRKAGKYE